MRGEYVNALGIAFVATNSAIANSAKKDIDSKKVVGKSADKLKEQEKYLKERIKAAKDGAFGSIDGFLESSLHGESDEAKIRMLQARLKQTQSAIKKIENPKLQAPQSTKPKTQKEILQGYKTSLGNLKQTLKTAQTQEQKDAIIRAMTLLESKIKEIKLSQLSTSKLIDIGLRERAFSKIDYEQNQIKPPISSHFGEEKPQYITSTPTLNIASGQPNQLQSAMSGGEGGEKNSQDTQQIMASIQSFQAQYQALQGSVQALQSQYQATQATVQTLANRPQQHNYHVSVTVNNAKSDQDVEGAVRRALASAKYESSQRSMSDL